MSERSEQEKIDSVVSLLKSMKPKNFEQANKFLPLEYIDSGAYRATYKIQGVPMVIKFPLHGHKSCKDHTRAEIKAVSIINRLKKYEVLRDLMPKIYYKHMGHGVVAMRYYKELGKSKAKFIGTVTILIEKVAELVWPEAMKERESVDIHQSNLGIDEDNNVVFIDLGYFLPLGKGYDGSW